MYKCSHGYKQYSICKKYNNNICSECPHGVREYSNETKYLNIIKENIDVIEANLQKKFQCADKEYMLTGNKDRLKEISEMLFYLDYLEKRKEFTRKTPFRRIPMIIKVNKKNGVIIGEKAYWYYINNKKIKQYNFKSCNIKGAKTLWKE